MARERVFIAREDNDCRSGMRCPRDRKLAFAQCVGDGDRRLKWRAGESLVSQLLKVKPGDRECLDADGDNFGVRDTRFVRVPHALGEIERS